MILADWYFCSAIRLSPSATHVFLDIAEALRQRAPQDRDLVLAALHEVQRAEQIQVLYLTADVIAAGEAFADDRTLRYVANDLIADVQRMANGAVSVPRVAAGQIRAKTKLDELARGVSVRATEERVRSERPYLDTIDFAAEVLVLAYLAHLCRAEPAAAPLVAQYPALATLVARAADGQYGRLPALLAGDVLLARDPADVRTRLASGSLGVAWLEPDLLEISARAWFGDRSAEMAEGLGEEFAGHEILGSLQTSGPAVEPRRLNEVRALLGVEAGRPETLSVLLWHATLAGLAACRGDARAAAWASGQLAAEHGTGPAAQISPWLRRVDGRWMPKADTPEEIERNSRFRRAADLPSFFYLLASTFVAVNLIRRPDLGEEQQDIALDLVLHAADVLADVRHRDILRSLASGGPLPTDCSLTLPLAALAVHTRVLLENVGACRVSWLQPDRLVDLVMDRHDQTVGDDSSDIGRLYQTPALMILRQWIFEVASGYTGMEPASASDRWFRADGGGLPPARRALVWIVTELQARARVDGVFRWAGLLAPAQLLVKQLWPDESLPNLTNWPARLTRPKVTIGAAEFLLNEPLSVQTWHELSAAAETHVGESGALLTLATERLAAALDAGDEDSFDAWFEPWSKLLRAVHTPNHLRRDLRRRLVGLFEIPAATAQRQRLLRRVLEQVVDVIVEFSTHAPSDLWSLVRALTGTTGEPGGSEYVQMLRLRFLQTACIEEPEQTWGRALTSPMSVLTERQEVAARRAAIRWFVRRHAASPAAVAAPRTLGEVYRELWEGEQLTTGVDVVSVSMGTAAPEVPDERWLTRVLVNYTERILECGLLDREAPAAVTNVVDLAGLTHEQRRRWVSDLGTTPSEVLGVIASASSSASSLTEGPGGARLVDLFVNCGLDNPVSAQARGSFATGEPVRVTLVRDSSSVVTCTSVAALGSRPQRGGEVRRAYVRSREGTCERPELVTVHVDGYPGDPGPLESDGSAGRSRREAWTVRWDPDTSASYRSGGEVCALARWDSAGSCWLPVDRSMTEFVADVTSRKGTADDTWVTLIHAIEHDTGHLWRLSTEPGICYALESADWTARSLAGLNQVRGDGSVTGLKVLVHLVERGGQVFADLGDQPQVDDHNLVWAAALDVGAAEEASRVLIAHESEDGWRLPVTVPGFDRTWIRVTGRDLLRRHGSAIVFPESWNGLDQRRGAIEASAVNLHSLTDPQDPDRDDRFARLLSLAPDSVVTLEALLGAAPKAGAVTWSARTVDGLLVQVDPESVTMAPISGSERSPGRGREVVIYEMISRSPQPREAHPLSDPEVLGADGDRTQGADLLSGLCAERPQDPGQQQQYFTIWLRSGRAARVCHVPASAFTVLPAAVGDPVTAYRLVDGGWVFAARPRTIRAALLWPAPKTVKSPPRDSVYLFSTEDGRHDVYQTTRGRPQLVLSTSAGERPHLSGSSHSLDALIAGSVTVRGQRGELRGEDGAIHGHIGRTRRNETYRVIGMTCSPMVVPAGGEERWRLRRELALEAVEQLPEQHDRRQLERWNEYLSREDRHLVGSLRGDHVHLPELEVPTGEGRWTHLVPLVTGERTEVADDEYVRDEVRVVLVDCEDDPKASFAQARPLDLDAFVDRLRSRGLVSPSRPTTLPAELRYAGRAHDDRKVHRFEWGYGWRLEVPEDRMEVVEKPVQRDNFPMFHGDRVRRASFPQRSQGVVLNLDQLSIEHDVGYQIYVEASEHRIVHQVDVDVELMTGTVRVRAVHGRKQGFSEGETDASQSLPVRNAELDDATTRWLLNEVQQAEQGANADTGVRRVEILAQLADEEFGRMLGEKLIFRRVTQLKPSQRVFLIAGDISERGNDAFLELRLPPNLLGWPGRPPRARVSRRAFAAREGLLRRLHRSGVDFKGSLMLVELRDPPKTATGPWEAHTRVPISRHVEHLFGYVAHQRGRAYAVLTEKRSAVIGLELRPGVYFSVPADRVVVDRAAEPGAVVRLVSLGDRLQIRCAVLHDRTYVPQSGRPSVVLPKQPLLRDKVPIEKAADANMFTVAGLANLQATAADIDPVILMKTLHPKTALVRPNGRAARLAPLPQDAAVGSVEVDKGRVVPLVRPLRGGSETEIRAAWSAISYADCGAFELAEMLAQRGWTVHDQETGHWSVAKDGLARVTPDSQRPRERVTAANGPVFFAQGYRLRYPTGELRRYGFPAGDVVVGSSDEIGREPADYAVAAPVDEESGGLWVEVTPGRVLELSADLLVAGPRDRYRPLRQLDWTRFSPGDQVRLALHQPEGNATEVACVALHSWTPGPRGAFGPGRTLLPAHSDPGKMRLVLGYSRYSLSYPVSPQQLLKSNDPKFGWLDEENGFTPLQPQDRAERGDTVLLGCDRKTGELFARGRRDWVVELAEDGDGWSGSAWMRRALEDPRVRAELLNLLDGALPVTVENVEGPKLVVSRRLQPPGVVPAGRWVRCQILGTLDESSVILAAGASLLVVQARHVVPGVPVGAVSRVARVLARDRRPKWFHSGDDGELRGGLPEEEGLAAGSKLEVPVEAMQVVAAAGHLGVLCRQADTASYRWMPAEEVGWVSDLTEGELAAWVRARTQPFSAVVRRDGTVSLLEARDIGHRLSIKRPGDPLRVVLATERAGGGEGLHRYLASVYQSDVLVEHQSSTAEAVGEDPLLVEVADVTAHPRRHLVVVPKGQRKLRIDLPAQVVAALKTSAYPECDDVDARLVESVLGQDDERCGLALQNWLTERGRPALGLSNECVDAPALCAAVVATSTLGKVSPEAPALRSLGVWLAWQLGARARRSLHVEPLVRHWLRHPEWLAHGEWQRLHQVANDIEPEVSEIQARDIKAFARGIIRRSRVRNDPALMAISNSLLDATGDRRGLRNQPVDVPTRIVEISALARAMAPPRDAVTAQAALLVDQQRQLRVALTDFVGDHLWLPLLPPALPLPEALHREGEDLLKAAIEALPRLAP